MFEGVAKKKQRLKFWIFIIFNNALNVPTENFPKNNGKCRKIDFCPCLCDYLGKLRNQFRIIRKYHFCLIIRWVGLVIWLKDCSGEERRG